GRHAEAAGDRALTEERRSDHDRAIGIGREEAVDLRNALAVANHRGRPPEPRELRQRRMTARSARDVAHRQRVELGTGSRDVALLCQHEREPASERTLLMSRADARFEQGDRLLETPLLPEELGALHEKTIDREAAERLASELESVVHALLRLGGPPFEEQAGHPEPRGVPEMERLTQPFGQPAPFPHVRL